MSSPKLRKRLLAGILCAGMIFQNVPMNVSANEDAGIVEEIENIETKTAEEEAKAENTQMLDAQETESKEIAAEESKKIEDTESGEAEAEEPKIEELEIEELEIEELETEDANTEESDTETDAVFEELRDNDGSEVVVDVEMKDEFPDEIFRSIVLGELEKLGLGTDVVSEKDLATIEEIKYTRESYDTPAIKEIKGIAYLTGLREVDLSYNEITDVSKIDWSNLRNLEKINLAGNEISMVPNFYRNDNLREVNLNENLLTREQISAFLRQYIAPNSGITLPDDAVFSQRIGDFKKDQVQVQVEDTYYVYSDEDRGDVVPVTVMVSGYKSAFPKTITFKIDGEDADFEHKQIGEKKYENIYWIEKQISDLKEGTHSIFIQLEQNESVSELTKTFTVKRQDCYPGKSEYEYHFSINSDDDVIDLYYTDLKNRINHLTFTDKNGKEYTYDTPSFKYSMESKDYRYKDIEGNPGLYIKTGYMNHAAFSMEDIIYALPTGTYDLNVFLKGDEHTQYTLENLIKVRSNEQDNWKYELSRGALYYNDEERNTATLSVTGAGDKAVKFEIEEFKDEPVTLTVDSDNPNKVVITAGDGTGSAVIKITVGASIQRVKVNVYERIYATELSMSPTDIVMEGVGKSADIEVTVTPSAALEMREELEITASDSDVFVVDRWVETETGIRISVKSVGGGLGTLTVKVKGSDVSALSCSCNISVTEGSFTETEKQSLLKNVGTIYCITNVDGTRLGDLTLPDGWEWVEPDTTVAVLGDAPAEVQRYSARYSRPSYTSFKMPIPVAVTQITGITVDGPVELTAGHAGTYSASLTYRGYYVESNKAFVSAVDKAVSFDWSSDSLFKLGKQDDEKRTVEATAKSVSADVMIGIVSASVTVGQDVFTDNYDVTVMKKHITDIRIVPDEEYRNNSRNFSAPYWSKPENNNGENVLYVDEADITPTSNRIKFNIEASTVDEKKEVKKGMFTWSINDSRLGEIKEADNGSVYLYIYGSGTIILRATANDVGEQYAEVAVEVRNYVPIFEADTIIVNKYAVDGSEIPVYAIEGNEVVSIQVSNENFKAVKSNGTWVMLITDATLYPKKTTLKAQLTLKTQMNIPLECDVKIIVDTTRPKVKFVQKTAPNLFYADTIAQYVVKTDYDIIGIEQDEDKANPRSKGFNLVSYNNQTGVLTVRADGLDKSTLSEFKNKNSEYCNLPLLVQYNGYGKQKENIKVTAKTKKPSLKVQEIALTAAGQTASAYLINASTKKKVPLTKNSSVSSLTDTIVAEKLDDGIKIDYTGDKNKSYKLLVSDSNWTEDLTISGKVSMVKSFSTQLDQKSITLNMAHNIRKNGSVPIDVSVKNSAIRVMNVEVEAANDKAAQLIDDSNGAPYLKVEYKTLERTLYLGLDGSNKPSGIKAGNYKFNVSAVIAGPTETDEGIKLSPATLTISLVDASKGPKVTLSGKGQINLIDRANTSVIYTPKISNMTSPIKSVKITGENRALFNASLMDDGKIEVKAVRGTVMNLSNYTVGLELGFENNVSILTSVKIKPVNKTPKLEAGKKNAVIYKAVNNDVKWNLYNRGDFGKITGVTLTDSVANEKFTISMKENQITLQLAEETKRTVDKGNYTVTYEVHFSDMAPDAKPVTMQMKITIK